jgi:hypothetical protein
MLAVIEATTLITATVLAMKPQSCDQRLLSEGVPLCRVLAVKTLRYAQCLWGKTDIHCIVFFQNGSQNRTHALPVFLKNALFEEPRRKKSSKCALVH